MFVADGSTQHDCTAGAQRRYDEALDPHSRSYARTPSARPRIATSLCRWTPVNGTTQNWDELIKSDSKDPEFKRLP